ncbi:MAG: hypothetical protein ABIJ95_09735 [Pseudomonadota bacterium]
MSGQNGWERFLEQVLGGDGAARLGEMVRGDFSGTVCLLGSGFNGRNTLLEALEAVLPDAEWKGDIRGAVLRIRPDFHLVVFNSHQTPWTVAEFLACNTCFLEPDSGSFVANALPADPDMLDRLLGEALAIREWAGLGPMPGEKEIPPGPPLSKGGGAPAPGVGDDDQDETGGDPEG